MLSSSPYVLRRAEFGDQELVRSLFSAAPPDGPSLFPRTQSESDWVTANPAPSIAYIADLQGDHPGRPVAHAELRFLRMRLAGDPALLGELASVSTAKEHLRALPRPGLTVALLGELLAAESDGLDLGAFALFAGNLWRVASRFLGFEMARWYATLEREPGPGSKEGRLPAGVEFLDHFDEQVLWLYDRACGAWSASAVRDANYLDWRVGAHPRRRYRTLAVRDEESILRGYAVTTVERTANGSRLWIADWLVPDQEPDVGALLVEGALTLARSVEADVVAAGFPEWSPWHLRFQEAGFAYRAGDWILGIRTKERACDSFVMRDAWWHQPLDLGLA